MTGINPLDLKIHINGMKSKAEVLKQEAQEKLAEADAIKEEAHSLENAFADCLRSISKDKS
jgi:FtsZ-binding cell division protein ZapB